MDKGTVVFLPCVFERGGFPTERLFTLRSRDAEFRGVADVRYCHGEDGRLLGDEPPEGARISGRLIGLIVRKVSDDTSRVHLPDGEVYDLETRNLVPAREVQPKYVPV